MSSEGNVADSKDWKLEPETEYRFELDPGTSLAIKLIRGRAEIFGAELAEGKVYLFGQECKAAVYTWEGCTIEMSLFLVHFPPLEILPILKHVTGRPSVEYISDETPMAPYANVHIAFEQMRVRALRTLHGSPAHDDDPASSTEPPRVLILGPENSGKTSVCKILINYAVRAGQGWCPILANLDPSEGGWASPGALSAAPIAAPLQTATPANTLGSAASSAPTNIGSNALLPLVYWYGHRESTRNHLLMERTIRNLGENVTERFDVDEYARVSGVIVDTPSTFASGPPEQRQRLIKACVDAFRINTILVVGHEKLNVEMQRTYGSTLTVVKIPKSGGVVELDHAYRERLLRNQLHAYMYGHNIQPPPGVEKGTLGGEPATDLVLAPSSTVIKFGDLNIYRIGAQTMAPSSALPIGAARVVSEMQPVPVDPGAPGSGLINSVLGLLAPLNPDDNERYDEELLDLSVIGFLVVTNLDIPNKKMTILSPNQGSVVGKTAIVGSLEWQEM